MQLVSSHGFSVQIPVQVSHIPLTKQGNTLKLSSFCRGATFDDWQKFLSAAHMSHIELAEADVPPPEIKSFLDRHVENWTLPGNLRHVRFSYVYPLLNPHHNYLSTRPSRKRRFHPALTRLCCTIVGCTTVSMLTPRTTTRSTSTTIGLCSTLSFIKSRM